MFRAPRVLVGCLALLSAALLAGAVANGATSSTVVTATVASATSLNTAACATSTAPTLFGTLLPATSNVTASDCSVVFGSSNDSAMLRLYQTDGVGNGMWRASNGTLDTSFGSGTGTVTTPLGSTGSNGNAVTTQPDGKILVAGYVDNGAGHDFAVLRYNTDGSLDTTWGGTGEVATTISTGNDTANSVVVQPDGKVLVGGYSFNGARDIFTVVGYTALGALDTSFGGTGIVATDAVAGQITFGTALALQPDGRVLLTGYNGGKFVTVRYNTDGSLDTSWGGTGIVATTVGPVGSQAWGIALQPDGKVLVTGLAANATNDVTTMRYNTDGSVDTTWGGTGQVTTDVASGDDSGQAVVVQPDGKIVIAGAGTVAGASEPTMLRYTATGTLDPSFGGTGIVSTPTGTTSGTYFSASLLPDGRIAAAGRSNASGVFQFFTGRYNTNGSLDTTWNGTGTENTPIGASAAGRAATVGPDGAYIVAGSGTGSTSMVVARYGSVSVPDYSSGITDWSTGANMFGACLNTVATGATTGAGPTPAATWQTNAGCPTSSGTWYPIPTTNAAAGAKIAQSTTTGTLTAQANLRFGLRTAANQPPGTYEAPVTFEVDAPNV